MPCALICLRIVANSTQNELQVTFDIIITGGQRTFHEYRNMSFILNIIVSAIIDTKVPTESLEYFVNHIFLDLFGNEVYCIVYHCKAISFCFTMIPYL